MNWSIAEQFGSALSRLRNTTACSADNYRRLCSVGGLFLEQTISVDWAFSKGPIKRKQSTRRR
jgi:hypothetical protein